MAHPAERQEDDPAPEVGRDEAVAEKPRRAERRHGQDRRGQNRHVEGGAGRAVERAGLLDGDEIGAEEDRRHLRERVADEALRGDREGLADQGDASEEAQAEAGDGARQPTRLR